MKTASVWSVLAVCCVACGSVFQASESASGGSGPGGSANGGDFASAGSTSNGGSSTDGGAASSGSGSAGRQNHGGSGGQGVGGDGISAAGDVSVGGMSGGSPGGGMSGSDSAGSGNAGGVVGSAGTSSSAGSGGSGTAGSAGTSSSAGSGGTTSDCDALWANYLNLRENATVCQLVQKGDCSGTVLPDQCGCNIPVSNSNADTAKAKEALKAIQNKKCPSETCFAPCKVVANPTCALGSSPDSATTCQGGDVATPQ